MQTFHVRDAFQNKHSIGNQRLGPLFQRVFPSIVRNPIDTYSGENERNELFFRPRERQRTRDCQLVGGPRRIRSITKGIVLPVIVQTQISRGPGKRIRAKKLNITMNARTVESIASENELFEEAVR